jgi:hypothetical protein
VLKTGLFSATVASFIIESYQNLSPNSSDTTNALLAQISQQLVSMSNGTPLTNIAEQTSQSFRPTASAVRVNVYWFLSLVLSLSCALSATLMQQWARRYRELAQRRGAFHRRGRMRAFIFDGISRFGMARAVATMPTLLHISVFLFFAGLVEFLFPIYLTVAYAVLGCIGVFAVAYAILTVLPNIYLNCPYSTPLSGITWRITQLSVMCSLWTVLGLERLFRKSSKLFCLANRHVRETDWLKRRETLEDQAKTRRQWFTQGMRKSVELSAYRADSTVVTRALEWTLAALDEDNEIEDFAARVPGFFDSRVVPDATLAVLPLMSHQPNTDPIFGPRLYDLLNTCIPETSILDEKMRTKRLRACMKCLWSLGKAYNQLGSSRLLPSYFPNALAIPEITRCVRAEEDSDVRLTGCCFGVLIANKLAADLDSRTDPISHGEQACLSAILGIESREVGLLLRQPGAIALANIISFMLDPIGLAMDTVPSSVPHVVQETLGILSQALSSVANAEERLDQQIIIVNGSDGKFEHILISRLLALLNMCIAVASPLTKEVRMSCSLMCLKGLWCFMRALDHLGNLMPLPSYVCASFANPRMTRHIYGAMREGYPPVNVIGRCVGALVVNKLATDIDLLNVPVSTEELTCLSSILGTKSDDVMLLLSHPRAIQFTNFLFLALNNFYFLTDPGVPSYVLDVVQKTLSALSRGLSPEWNVKMQLNQTETLTNISEG